VFMSHIMALALQGAPFLDRHAPAACLVRPWFGNHVFVLLAKEGSSFPATVRLPWSSGWRPSERGDCLPVAGSTILLNHGDPEGKEGTDDLPRHGGREDAARRRKWRRHPCTPFPPCLRDSRGMARQDGRV